MPIYQIKCPDCGKQEIFRNRMTGCEQARCPKCGKKSERDWSALMGFHPFVSYWTEALSSDPHRPVHVDTREKERRLKKKFGFERVS